MYSAGSEHYLLVDYQRCARRAAARERLSLVEQGARGLLDTPHEQASRRSLRGLRSAFHLMAQTIKQVFQRAAAARALFQKALYG